MSEQERIWQPPARSVETGHRISTTAGWQPVETRHLSWLWWLAEWPMRWLARSMRYSSTWEETYGEKKADE